jgi:hypothetical protein
MYLYSLFSKLKLLVMEEFFKAAIFKLSFYLQRRPIATFWEYLKLLQQHFFNFFTFFSRNDGWHLFVWRPFCTEATFLKAKHIFGAEKRKSSATTQQKMKICKVVQKPNDIRIISFSCYAGKLIVINLWKVNVFPFH